MELENIFLTLLSNYTNNSLLKNTLWKEIETKYSSKKRYYHNLSHLDNLLNELIVIKDKIEDWNVILFTLFYHDVIYNSLKQNNEEKSAELAKERMSELLVDKDKINKCYEQILATKTHTNSLNIDTNYFIDADLSILGKDWNEYYNYAKNVRKEYAIYPKLIYNSGRKKALTHFLNMNRIYKTEYFYNQYEAIAKDNIKKELLLL